MSAIDPQASFADALAAFQAEMPLIRKGQTATVKSDKGSYSYDYADLTDITEHVAPVLAKHGLSWTATPTLTDGGAFVLRYALLHRGGHRECGDYPLPDPSRSSAQQIGSALTYARRYALCAVTGVAPGGDDDDGEKAADARARSPHAAPEPPAPQRVTDRDWMAGFDPRITAAASVSEVRGLWAEMKAQHAAGRLTDDDRAALEAALTARSDELKPEGAMV